MRVCYVVWMSTAHAARQLTMYMVASVEYYVLFDLWCRRYSILASNVNGLRCKHFPFRF